MAISNNSNSRAAMLNTIEAALKAKTAKPFIHKSNANPSVVPLATIPLLQQFTINFTKLLGNVIHSQSQAQTVKNLQTICIANNYTKIFCAETTIINLCHANGWQLPLHNNLATCHVSITTCECLVARTGSLMLSSALPQGRTASVYAPVHICVAKEAHLVYDIEDAWQKIHLKYGKNLPSSISLATGPSRTADIEKTLVVGVHGPKEVFCFIEA